MRERERERERRERRREREGEREEGKKEREGARAVVEHLYNIIMSMCVVLLMSIYTCMFVPASLILSTHCKQKPWTKFYYACTIASVER